MIIFVLELLRAYWPDLLVYLKM